MTPEQKLAALLAVESPPRRDFVFEAGVAERIARRRAWLAVAALLPWMLVSGCIFWAMAPMLEQLFAALPGLVSPIALVMGLTAVAGGAAMRLAGLGQRRVRVAATPK
ncbi:hypothetical protein [Brevundimonas sp. FT23028]|uniref:hypothetical protein n=1 Tax=Brevundimonas sp. FT23028 TaxID=3393748 RepID=UPI003B585F95